MSTPTAHYGLQKPAVNDPVDQDVWGNILNADLDIISDVMYRADNRLKRAVTATDNVILSDKNKIILANATAGNITLNLLATTSAEDGYVLTVNKTDASTNTVTIDGSGTETINGATSFVLSVQNQSVTLISDGAGNWNMLTPIVPAASDILAGIVRLATIPEVAAGILGDVAMSPDAFLGNSVIGAQTSYILPGPLILKCGSYASNITGETSASVVFNDPFPNNCFMAMAIAINNTATAGANSWLQNVSRTTTTYTVFNQGAPGGSGFTINGFDWFAIGN